MKKIDFSVVIAIHNEEQNLPELRKRLLSSATKISATFEVIFVDDASTDRSLVLIKKFFKEDKRFKYISLTRGFGQHGALLCGISYTKGELVITMDGDLQHRPEDLTKLVNQMKNGKFDVVYGRFVNKKHSLLQNIGSSLAFAILAKITGAKVKVTSFRIFTREIAEKISKNSSYPVIISSLIWRVVSANRIGEIELTHQKRKAGKTKYSFKKLITFFFGFLTSYSTAPMIAAVSVGFSIILLSFFYALFFIINYFGFGLTISYWTLALDLIVLLFGITIFFIGALGYYLSAIYWTTVQRPVYEIRESSFRDLARQGDF